jgi:hypothetical protein
MRLLTRWPLQSSNLEYVAAQTVGGDSLLTVRPTLVAHGSRLTAPLLAATQRIIGHQRLSRCRDEGAAAAGVLRRCAH